MLAVTPYRPPLTDRPMDDEARFYTDWPWCGCSGCPRCDKPWPKYKGVPTRACEAPCAEKAGVAEVAEELCRECREEAENA